LGTRTVRGSGGDDGNHQDGRPTCEPWSSGGDGLVADGKVHQSTEVSWVFPPRMKSRTIPLRMECGVRNSGDPQTPSTTEDPTRWMAYLLSTFSPSSRVLSYISWRIEDPPEASRTAYPPRSSRPPRQGREKLSNSAQIPIAAQSPRTGQTRRTPSAQA
jgi:hypothetical protein